jgi:TPR repeat protein
MGWLLRHGWGLPLDYAQAIDWFKKSAAQGNVHAMNNMGYVNEHGLGVSVDLNEAKKWYQQAADKGYKKALHHLQKMQRDEEKGG